METRNIDFLKVKNNLGEDILQPCLSLEELSVYGIIINKFPELKTSKISVRIFQQSHKLERIIYSINSNFYYLFLKPL